MKFMCNTKPLVDSVSVGIINSNVSNFYKKSCILQLTASKENLKINIEAQNICTEINIPGNGSEDEESTVFIDSIKFKNLLNTLDSNTLSLEFESWGLTLRSGKSKFTLPKIIDEGEFELKSPTSIDDEKESIEFTLEDWKFVQNKQLFALSQTFINPIYTKIWVGEGGDCLTGDMDTGVFTHSIINGLGVTCLLSDTIVRLFTSLPDNSKFIAVGDGSYIIESNNDSYKYRTEFKPMYESTDDVGEYNSDIFLTMMEHPTDYSIISSSALNKVLNQATLLSTSSNIDTVTFMVNGSNAAIIDTNMQSEFTCKGSDNLKYESEFRLPLIKKVASNFSDEIYIAPLYQEDDVAGILMWDDSLTTILSGVE